METCGYYGRREGGEGVQWGVERCGGERAADR